MANESSLLGFFRETSPDSEGRMFSAILARDDDWLECTHNYIQWLFPLRERSRFNSDAPILSGGEIAAFRSDEKLRAQLCAAFKRMLRFYGFEIREAGGQVQIVEAENWPDRSREWLTPYNHNFLRITRILTALRTLGLEDCAGAFFQALSNVYGTDAGTVIGAETFRFWKSAAGE